MRFLDETSIRPAPDAVSRVVAGEAILVDLKSGQYFGLDAVGTRIWELIGDRGTFGGVLEGVLEEFDVEPGRAREDLERLVGELADRGLVDTTSVRS